MSHGLLADMVGLIHAAFVLFVTGGLAAILAGWKLRWRWTESRAFRIAHLAAIAVVVLQTWLGELCPLTIWENQLRHLAGQEGVGTSFIGFWIERLLYWRLPAWVFLAAYTIFGGLVVATFVWYPPGRGPRPDRGASIYARVTPVGVHSHDVKPARHRRHDEVLREFVPLAGRRIADIGCGDGALARLMARAGAHVIGVDNNPAQLGRAAAATPAADEIYVMAVGERLPFPAASFDAVVIFNALHHIPVAAQSAALAEVARVLRPGGLAYIAEPLAEGANFELARLVDDETEVRARAYQALRDAVAQGVFREERETVYVHPMLAENFQAFAERMVRVEPGRKSAVVRHETELRERFRRLGRPSPAGVVFDQPMRANLLVTP